MKKKQNKTNKTSKKSKQIKNTNQKNTRPAQLRILEPPQVNFCHLLFIYLFIFYFCYCFFFLSLDSLGMRLCTWRLNFKGIVAEKSDRDTLSQRPC